MSKLFTYLCSCSYLAVVPFLNTGENHVKTLCGIRASNWLKLVESNGFFESGN